jgi:hypothetical protein
MRNLVVLAFALAAASSPAAAQDVLWKCSDPSIPFRFVSTAANKNLPPPCNEWLQIRGPNLYALLNKLAPQRFQAANEFLAEAAEFLPIEYPGAAEGAPVLTSDIYARPQRFGLEEATPEAAPPGSLVIYNGLGGILVESRRSEDEPWTEQVLYPSAATGFQLVVSDLNIGGKQAAKVLIRSDGAD